MLWDNVVVTVRWIFTAALFIGGIPVMGYGAAWLMLGDPGQRFAGLVLLAIGLVMWPLAMWLSLGRPRDWFEPGGNTDFDPRR